MPALLFALFDLIKVGAGMAGVAASTALLLVAFGSFFGAWVALSVIIRTMVAHLDPHIICVISAFGGFNCMKLAFSLVAGAFAIRLTRFLAVRAAEALAQIKF